jgi:hypothetical protein
MSRENIYKRLLIDLVNCAELSQEDLEVETQQLIEEVNMALMSDDEEVVDEFDIYEDDESDSLYDN